MPERRDEVRIDEQPVTLEGAVLHDKVEQESRRERQGQHRRRLHRPVDAGPDGRFRSGQDGGELEIHCCGDWPERLRSQVPNDAKGARCVIYLKRHLGSGWDP